MVNEPRSRFAISGVIRDDVSFAAVAEALRPLLARRFEGDPRLDLRIKDEWNELRIEATNFDLHIVGGTFGSSYDLGGSLDDAIAFYREIGSALKRHGIWNEIEIMQQQADLSWETVAFIEDGSVS